MLARESAARFRWVVLGIAFLAQGSNALSIQAIAPLAPLFQPELGLSKAEVGFFSAAAFAGAWGVLLIAGSLTDRFGVRRMISAGQLMAGVLLLSMSMVRSFYEAVAVLLAVGVGRAATAPAMTKGIADWFPPTARGTALGVKQTAVPITGIFMASTLPAIALVVGWRSAVAMVGLMIILNGLIAVTMYRDVPPSKRAVGGRAGTPGALGVVLRNRRLWTMSAMSLLYLVPQIALIAYLPLYLKEIVLVPMLPDEPTRIVAAGGYLALCQMGGVFGRVFWGVVSDRVFQGRRMVVMVLIGGLTTALSLATSQFDSTRPLWLLAAMVGAYGATAMGWNGLYQALIVETAGARYAGTGTGLSMTLSQLGSVGGAPLFGFVVDVTGSYQPAWLLLGGFAVAGTLVAVASVRGERRVA